MQTAFSLGHYWPALSTQAMAHQPLAVPPISLPHCCSEPTSLPHCCSEPTSNLRGCRMQPRRKTLHAACCTFHLARSMFHGLRCALHSGLCVLHAPLSKCAHAHARTDTRMDARTSQRMRSAGQTVRAALSPLARRPASLAARPSHRAFAHAFTWAGQTCVAFASTGRIVGDLG